MEEKKLLSNLSGFISIYLGYSKLEIKLQEMDCIFTLRYPWKRLGVMVFNDTFNNKVELYMFGRHKILTAHLECSRLWVQALAV
jgi:hypothetical protein